MRDDPWGRKLKHSLETACVCLLAWAAALGAYFALSMR